MKRLVIVILGAALLASCRSSKKMTKDDRDVVGAKVETITPVKKAPTHNEISSKVRVKIVADDGNDLSTNGQLKMRWDDVIQISLVDPLLGVMEVGRMEISTDSVLVIDRVNKRYISDSYQRLSTLTGVPVTFDMVQDLFWEQVQKTGANGTVNYTIPFSKPVTLELKLGNINYDSGWNGHTAVSSKYQKVSVEALFKALLNNE
ncbi:MAG: DUF4292 domain-containing protein [Bacteroidaceae bacterium]|nr:DUF4292 domain-containing protein [Bacteroidaceae bacterium]